MLNPPTTCILRRPFNLATGPRTRGFSLIEILLVIGVVLVLAIMVFSAYTSVRYKAQATAEHRNIITVLGGATKKYRGNFRGVNNLILNRDQLIPPSLNGGNFNTAELINRWNGAVTILPSDGSAAPCDPASTVCPGLRFEYERVPAEVCMAMVPVLRASFRHIQVKPEDGSEWTVVMGNYPAVAYDPNAMIQACDADNRVRLLIAT